MMLVNPYTFGATLSTVINYEFNGTDGDTTTTDSTGNTTCSGLGVVSGSSYAYIFNNKLLARNNYTTIDDTGSLSPYLSFAGDFEIEVAASFNDWAYDFGETLWRLQNGAGNNVLSLDVFKDGNVELSSSTGILSLTTIAAGINLASQQVIKLARVGSTLSLYVDDVLKGSVTMSYSVDAGRFKFWTSNFERFVDYLRIKKV